MANGEANGILGNLPVWARLISLVGIPGVVAIYLVYFLTQSIAADVQWNRQEMSKHTEVVIQHTQEATAAHDLLQASLNAYLAQICRNTSQNLSDRISCDRIAEPRRGTR